MLIRSDEFEDIETPTGPMRTYIFRPADEGRSYPGVVYFSEIFQLTDPIRRFASFIAGQGYVVAVPEVYHEYEPAGTVLGYDQVGADRGNELKYRKPLKAYDDDATAVLKWLARYKACSGKLATLGVCLGGHLALRAAFNQGVLAAACFYATDVHSATLGEGKKDDTLKKLPELKAETMFVWGRQDPHIPYEGRRLIRDRLEESQIHFEWHEYNGQHAFLRDEGPRYDPALFMLAIEHIKALFAKALV
ncbi:dienelactone hydrolase family protein [Entomobacter blattae]|uniref:Carboxymethylenebutenolidase n=1 Tax=Entomobacter blattae TaxID=2762277 RepID=A0A7H1NPL4_9PROT|nr:dienelactone hydrolase family protein [Entomobacter blattae]QNT77724.1 Carboxymethylenebutenolidase [Entomobacter blattae]